MIREKIIISGRECNIFHHDKPEYLLIQPVDEHDTNLLDHEVDIISELAEKPFCLVTFRILNWNKELTPWSAPPVFGKEPFGNEANMTLAFILTELLPYVRSRALDAKHIILGGYSLAGLFALWASYQMDLFDGIVAASPSVWYPDWINYATCNNTKTTSVYLSLGDKEEKTKNLVMAQVGDAIRKQYLLLQTQKIRTTLEWNPGNHFVDSEKRMAKGFAWIIQ